MEDVTASDRIAGHQGDDGLGHAPHVALKLQDVEPRDAVTTDVAGVAPHLLIASGAEGIYTVRRRPLTRQEDHADVRILPRVTERVLEVQERFGTEGVSTLRAIDRDSCDAVRTLVCDVLVFPDDLPLRRRILLDRIAGLRLSLLHFTGTRSFSHSCLHRD